MEEDDDDDDDDNLFYQNVAWNFLSNMSFLLTSATFTTFSPNNIQYVYNFNRLKPRDVPNVVIYIYSLRAGSGRFRSDPARKLSANLYDIYHCCVYSEKLLMIDGGTVRTI